MTGKNRGVRRYRQKRLTALTWAAIAEVSLTGVFIIWSISPSAAAHASYGRTGSLTMLAMSMVLTLAGAVTAIMTSQLGKWVRLAVAILVAVTAGGVVPLTLPGLAAPTAPGAAGALGPLILAIAGMEFVAAHLIRGRPSPLRTSSMTTPVTRSPVTAPGRAAPRSDTQQPTDRANTIRRPGRFVVLEGLTGVGKSTVAPLLAAALGADLVETQVPELTQARHYVDTHRSVNARLHFWLMANYVIADVVQRRLSAGHDVVIESYFYRTHATHAAMGARLLPAVDWDAALIPDHAIELTLHEPVRQRRLAERSPGGSGQYWAELAESGVAELRKVYDTFNLTRLDTTDLSPTQVVDRVQRLITTPRAVPSGANNGI